MTDASAPEPTDAAWPKWAGYGLALGGAVILDWAMSESSDKNSCEDDENDSNSDTDQNDEEKSKSREKGDRWKSADDPLQQLEEIEEAQKEVRKGKIDHHIDSIEKSRQRAKHRLRRIRSFEDSKNFD